MASRLFAPVTLRLELLQDSLTQPIGQHIINTYTTPSYDPRPIRGRATVSLTAREIPVVIEK